MKDTREMREIGRVCEKKRSLPLTAGGRSELGGGSTKCFLQQNLNILRRDTAARQRHGTQGQAGRQAGTLAFSRKNHLGTQENDYGTALVFFFRYDDGST